MAIHAGRACQAESLATGSPLLLCHSGASLLLARLASIGRAKYFHNPRAANSKSTSAPPFRKLGRQSATSNSAA